MTRAFAAMALAASCAFTAAPAPALALDPPQPLPAYEPAFVTEREPGAWEDCTWAAAAMLLDKWTNGVTTVGRERLRTLSGDRAGGSNLEDVERAFAIVGLSLQSSPRGDSISWPELLGRLEQGGGAILLGDYGKLPRQYGRWDWAFWGQQGANDDHALYLDRFDRQTDRILVMDPLAPAGWRGEWVPVRALKRYAWRTAGGALWTAMTPAALAAPFEGVHLGDPVASADASALHVSWPIEQTPQDWTYAGASVASMITAVESVEAVDPFETVVAALPARGSAPLPLAPATDVADGVLSASIPLPAAPGVYRVTVTVTDHRFGAEVATAGPFNLYVPGARAAAFVPPGGLSAETGELIRVAFGVRNVGTASWVDPPLVPSLPLDMQRPRNTRLVGTWVMAASVPVEVAGAVTAPHPVELGPLLLEPGYGQLVDVLVRVPADAGTWRFVIDVVDDVAGAFALSGSAPGGISVHVTAPLLDSTR